MKTTEVFIKKEEFKAFEDAVNDCRLDYDIIREDVNDVLIRIYYQEGFSLFRLGRMSIINERINKSELKTI